MEKHWNDIYAQRKNIVSWYEDKPTESLKEIGSITEENKKFSIIDIGCGMSKLVDNLLEIYKKSNVTLLDISENSLEITKKRLTNEQRTNFICSPINQHKFKEEQFDIWHDRAVFHFLNEQKEQDQYVENCYQSLKKHGHAIIMTFSDPDGPDKCSGIKIKKYSIESLNKKFGERFKVVNSRKFVHVTPAEKEQSFICCTFEKQ
eukprot:gene9280-1367_t